MPLREKSGSSNPWQLYFSCGLIGPFPTRFAKRVRDCDELSSNCRDDNLMWFSGGAKTVSKDLQDRIVMAGDKGCRDCPAAVLRLGQRFWLKELITCHDFPPMQDPVSDILDQIVRQVKNMYISSHAGQ